jgi:hypothetical protein
MFGCGHLLALLLRQCDADIGHAAWIGLAKPDQPIARLWALKE